VSHFPPDSGNYDRGNRHDDRRQDGPGDRGQPRHPPGAGRRSAQQRRGAAAGHRTDSSAAASAARDGPGKADSCWHHRPLPPAALLRARSGPARHRCQGSPAGGDRRSRTSSRFPATSAASPISSAPSPWMCSSTIRALTLRSADYSAGQATPQEDRLHDGTEDQESRLLVELQIALGWISRF
jgi:hypothetical protein